jgi:hypothetical protein
MTSSSILVLLLPAMIVSVGLLVGFAACDRVFGLSRVDSVPPIIDSATGKDGVTIALAWHGQDTVQNYQFERTDPSGGVGYFDAPYPAAPFDDTNLAPATRYQYRVRGIYSSGDPGDWSAPVTGTTQSLASAYSKTPTGSKPGWAGYTVVQRIESAHLAATGPHVRITVQAGADSDASIDRLYISQADPAGKPYDSAADLTAVYDSAANQQQPFVVPAGTTRSLPIVAYTVNRFQALLIAFDFSASPASTIAAMDGVPTSEASAFRHPPPANEAATRSRSPGYFENLDTAMNSAVLFITNVEVG